ncbi:MAG: LysR substrate-binding domain-containing protein, partial [Telluria sp.]
LEAQPRVTWKDVARYPFISLQGQFTERLLDDVHASMRELAMKPANEVTFMTTALAMVSAGLGVTVCLPYAAPLASLYGLVLRPLEEPVLTRRFFIYTRPGRSLSPAAESFIGFLENFVRQNGA